MQNNFDQSDYNTGRVMASNPTLNMTANLISQELKQMGTLEVRFDTRGQEALVKDEALKRY